MILKFKQVVLSFFFIFRDIFRDIIARDVSIVSFAYEKGKVPSRAPKKPKGGEELEK
jgi:hypothetical protein